MASSVLQKLDDSHVHDALVADDSDAYFSAPSDFGINESSDIGEKTDLVNGHPALSFSEKATDDTTKDAPSSRAVDTELPVPDVASIAELLSVKQVGLEYAKPLFASPMEGEGSAESDRKTAVRHPLEAEDEPNELENFLPDTVMVDIPEPVEKLLEDPLGAYSAAGKKNKKVTFRGEASSDLVTEFVDAPDPWHYGIPSFIIAHFVSKTVYM